MRRIARSVPALLAALLALGRGAWAAPGVSDPAFLRLDAVVGSFPDRLAASGLRVVDVDGDGTPEILVGHDRAWYVLGRDEAGRFRERHFHPIFAVQTNPWTVSQDSIVAVRPGDFDGDGRVEVAVLHASGRLEFFDAASGAALDEQQTGVSGAASMAAGPLDGGAADRLAIVSPDGLYVVARGTAAPLWSVPQAGGVAVAIGQLDHDAALEIAVARDDPPGVVVDAQTHEIEWSDPLGFGVELDVGDVDGDGLAEIATVSRFGEASVIDADTHTRKWVAGGHGASSVRVVDVDGDGVPEILLDGGQWNGLSIVDGVTGTARGNVPSTQVRLDAFDAGALEGGCAHDVVFATGLDTTGAGVLWVSSADGTRAVWQSPPDTGPTGFAVGDVDGVGRTRVLRTTRYGAYLYDLAARRELWQTPLLVGVDSFTPPPVTLAAVGGAGMAIVSGLPSSMLTAADGATRQTLWTVTQPAAALAAGDVDGDGISEILAANGSNVSLLKGTTGGTLWTSPNLSGTVLGVALANVSGGPGAEILAAVSGQGLFAWGGTSHALLWLRSLPKISAFDVADVDGDGDPDVVIGTSEGALYAYDGASLALLFQGSVEGGSIVGLRVGDLAGDGQKEIVVVTADASMKVLRASDRSVLWDGGRLEGRDVAAGNRLFIGDADDDGRVEVIASSATALFVFEGPAPADTAPPVFSGAPGVQSAAVAGCCSAVDLAWNEARDAASPPVTYRVYRGAAPGFVPSPATLVAETPFTAWEDVGVARGATWRYVVRAADRLGNEDANDVELAASVPGGPAITLEPVSVDSCLGSSASFSVAAEGVPPLSYQWYHDGVALPGKTSPTLSLPALLAEDAGAYRCVVTDSSAACPAVASSGALLRIVVKPGDLNEDCAIDVSDVFFLVNYLFAGGPPPPGDPDVNGDEILDVRDAFYLINYVFSGGPPPALPAR